jgi:hypothetical protein
MVTVLLYTPEQSYVTIATGVGHSKSHVHGAPALEQFISVTTTRSEIDGWLERLTAHVVPATEISRPIVMYVRMELL